METICAAGSEQVVVPAWVKNYESFRRWMHSGEFPEEGKIVFINGNVWVDLSMEDFSSHNAVKAELGAILHLFLKQSKFGRFFPDGMRYGHPDTELSTEPDGIVVSHEALREERVRFVGGASGIQSELVGSPEIIIEIVSESSEVPDTEWAMSACFDAEIEEYWLIDARKKDNIRFDIYKRGKKEFAAVRKSGGWVKSAVLGKSFQLTQSKGEDGNPEYTLELR